ncbi:hypothetical protein R6Z07F_014239 [Ovis aries]
MQESGGTALCLSLPLLRSPPLRSCRDASTQGGADRAPGNRSYTPATTTRGLESSVRRRSVGRSLTGSARVNAGPQGFCKHQRAPARTERLETDTRGRLSKDNSNEHGGRPCSVEMTTKGKKLRRSWRILETEDSVAEAVQILLSEEWPRSEEEGTASRSRSRDLQKRLCLGDTCQIWAAAAAAAEALAPPAPAGPRRVAGTGPWKVASASAAASTLSEPPRRTQESQTRTRALGLPMEQSAASPEPPGPRPVLGRDSVQVPDDQDFRSFRSECEAEAGWNLTYSKAGVSVWVQAVEMDRTLHKIKCRMECRDVPAETLYDVLHDIEYRKKWDSNVIETFDIARLTVNADVGYYSWRCPKPLKNRDVITLRSWLPMGTDYIIMNYSVKHPKYPPRKDLVRAVSIQTGYLIQSTGPKSCVITYLAQVDPKGSLPKWVVNKSSQFLAPKAMKKMYKACVKYPEWKQKHQPHFKPWLHPEQSSLPSLALSELSVQHADSLENIDESAVAESREDRTGSAGGGEGSDDDTSLT